MRIKVINGNHPEGEGVWLELPVSENRLLQNAVGKLPMPAAGDGDSFPLNISDVDSPVKDLKKHIMQDTGRASVAQMNLLAMEVSVMTDADLQKFSGAMEIESAIGMKDILWIAENLDSYELLSDITDERSLGFYLAEIGAVPIHESARRYVDYSIIGAEYMSGHSCAYADSGLVIRKEDAGQHRAVIFDLKISSDYYEGAGAPPLRLTLPAGEERLDALAGRLRARSIDDCIIAQSKCPIADLDKLIGRDANIKDINELAVEIECLSKQDGQLMKLCAVLDAEKPGTLKDALRIACDLDDYEQIKANSPYDYGLYVLYQSDLSSRDINFQEEVRDFIDFEEYGKCRMEEDGVRDTALGMVRRISEPLPRQAKGMNMEMK